MRLAANPERIHTTDEIACAFGISRHHLIKVIRELAAAGIVATQRGAGGGFRLARPADDLTLGEIVCLLEARSALVECFRRRRLRAHVWMPTQGQAEGRARGVSARAGPTLAECAYPAGSKAPLPLPAA